MANYIQYIPQVNSTTYPVSINDAFTALTTDVTALEDDKLDLAGGTMTGTILNFDSTGIEDNAASTVIKMDDDSTTGNTRFFIYDVDNGTLERVTVGAADSGGTGYKLLRIANT